MRMLRSTLENYEDKLADSSKKILELKEDMDNQSIQRDKDMEELRSSSFIF
jgi:hypothetical protein